MMTEMATFTFQVDEKLKAAFDAAAAAHEKDSAEILRDFMQGYVELGIQDPGYDDWFSKKVASAIEAADAGDIAPDDKVEAEFSQLRNAARKSSAG